MDKERYIFEKFRSKLNGDDCAVIGERAYCKDLFVEGVHFRRGWLSLREIGAKAMLVNISDMIATNARAKYALLGLALPREIGTREIDELCAGVSETAREWGIRIIGGDTIGSDRIALSVSLIGKCKCPVFRSGARVGDLIAHTGELGSVGRDLAVLLRDEISPASSQTQNRNDKISSLQGPSDEVRSSGDKISPARAGLQSLDDEASAQNFAAQEGGGFDDLRGSSSFGDFGGEISTKSFNGKISAPSPDDGNSTRNLDAAALHSASQSFVAQNSDTRTSQDGLQGSAAQNQDTEFFEQNLNVRNSTGNFMAQNSSAGNFTEASAMKLAAESSAEPSSSKTASENSVTPLDMKFAEGISVQTAVKFDEERSACEIRGALAAGNLALRDDLSASSTVENFTRKSPAASVLQNFTCENSAIQSIAQQNGLSASLTAQNSTAQSLACENSVSQSPVCEGFVFDLREDLRAQISKNSRFVRPVLRDKFFYKAAKFISAAMDISDGLAQDLPRLLEASGVGARWIARPSEAALQSGEEYEILFSFAPKFLPKIYAIAAKAGVSINIIAEVCPRTPQSSMEFRGSSHHFAP